jgi:hypothetical protein
MATGITKSAPLPVLRRISAILALLAVMQMIGGHWLALQSVAWIEMVIDYSKQSSFSVAFEKTFGGANPCHLCKTVSKGRSQEQKNEKAKLVVKFEAVLADEAVNLTPETDPVDYQVLAQYHAALKFPPPTPPPLAA